MLDKVRFVTRHAVGRLNDRTVWAAERLLPSLRVRVCPCCGWSGLRFRSFVVVEYVRTDAVCPGCGAFERHRALAEFYPKYFASLDRRPSRVVHFAPEKCLERLVGSLCDRYERSVYGGTGVEELALDLTALSLEDGSRDMFLMNHVLDCMDDDRAAVREMFRVLRPGGSVLAVASFKSGARTRELPVASNSRHRIYGSEDLGERFRPFAVSVVDAAGDLDPKTRRRCGVAMVVPLLILRKPTDGNVTR